MKTAQALLGHSDLKTTLNVYTHALPASQRRAVERVSEVMFSIVLELGENDKEGKSKSSLVHQSFSNRPETVQRQLRLSAMTCYRVESSL